MAEDLGSDSRQLYGGLYLHNGQNCTDYLSILVDDANIV